MYKRNLSITKSGVKIPIKSLVRTVPHYPKQGIMFRDITAMLKNPIGLRITIDEMIRRYKDVRIDMIASIELRGFIIGAPLAYALCEFKGD
jgi:adenine phosphoribosyltransferase